ncbi:MAG: hypothetical protein ACK8QZ_10340 [Anaerolineales bacterium]
MGAHGAQGQLHAFWFQVAGEQFLLQNLFGFLEMRKDALQVAVEAGFGFAIGSIDGGGNVEAILHLIQHQGEV